MLGLVGLAGLAACGYVPVVSTFALFIALRAGEQVRSQAAYTALNVKLVGGYAGLSDYADGASHQSVEDIAVMRAIPNMTVIAPSDITETRMALRAAIAHDGPVFLRLSREAVTEDYGPDHPFAIGKGMSHVDTARTDTQDAESLYQVLEDEVIPLYYDRDIDGLPQHWIKRMMNSISSLAWRFSSHRMVADYVLHSYLPAAGGLSVDMNIY